MSVTQQMRTRPQRWLLTILWTLYCGSRSLLAYKSLGGSKFQFSAALRDCWAYSHVEVRPAPAIQLHSQRWRYEEQQRKEAGLIIGDWEATRVMYYRTDKTAEDHLEISSSRLDDLFSFIGKDSICGDTEGVMIDSDCQANAKKIEEVLLLLANEAVLRADNALSAQSDSTSYLKSSNSVVPENECLIQDLYHLQRLFQFGSQNGIIFIK